MSRVKSKDRLIYLPLGGAGEIGMNAYVYGYGAPNKERLILVDLGVTFPDMDTTPGVDLIMPDLSWLEARKDRLEAIFITHGHEDHIGALGHMWEKLGAPVYARPFTAHLAKRKMAEHGQPEAVVTTIEMFPKMIECGPFSVSYVPVSHSIPESSGLLIESPKGRVLHTGDFKIDRTPQVGDPFDDQLWGDISEGGIKALVCDSTNVFSPSEGRSEASIQESIGDLIKGSEGMLVATTFASNIARLRTLAQAGVDAGRSVCLLGRSMQRMTKAAQETDVLTDFPPVISVEEAKDLPRDQVMLLVTGSQGERRAASAQLARGKYQGLSLKEGDSFLFSSKTIPGNERGVISIMNQLSERGVDVIEDHSGLYHVSGHANRPDLAHMHSIVKPDTLVPMHGEHRHLREHVKLGGESGIHGVLAVNGTMVDLGAQVPTAVEYIETGRRYLDGSVQIGQYDGIVRDRIRMALNGHIVVTVLLDEHDEPLGEPWCDLMGLSEVGRSGAGLSEAVEAELTAFLKTASAKQIRDEVALEKALKSAARRAAHDEIGKKPEVTVVISRLA